MSESIEEGKNVSFRNEDYPDTSLEQVEGILHRGCREEFSAAQKRIEYLEMENATLSDALSVASNLATTLREKNNAIREETAASMDCLYKLQAGVLGLAKETGPFYKQCLKDNGKYLDLVETLRASFKAKYENFEADGFYLDLKKAILKWADGLPLLTVRQKLDLEKIMDSVPEHEECKECGRLSRHLAEIVMEAREQNIDKEKT